MKTNLIMKKTIAKVAKLIARKLGLAGLAVLAILIAIPLFSAFEAHVINVTAKIENALSVPVDPIDFGTVFPQEELDQTITIDLSSSFMAEDNADDVNYIIRQKPKCAWVDETGQQIWGETKSAHVTENGKFVCPESDDQGTPPTDYTWQQLPLLCRYLSKHDLDLDDQNDDEGLDAFHEIGAVVNGSWVWNDVRGKLAKSQNDISDSWNIDLKVPCFEGGCAQDWESYVQGINPEADPALFIEPADNEGKIFGCDLWVEVTGVSRVEQPAAGGQTASISLENKDTAGDWNIIDDDDIFGTLVYVTSGPTFDYTLTAQGLQPNTNYSLIYYADPWPGNNPGKFIGLHTTDSSGVINGAGSPNLNMDLPSSPDPNPGAKIWLVPSSDYNGVDALTDWNPANYLFEYNTITYNDTDI